MKLLAYFLAGLVFGLGLLIAGMSNPAKVLNFLDVAAMASGAWDASLAFVMAGAIAVAFVGYRLAWRRERPVFDVQFHLPKITGIDAKLLSGSAIFGIGWGLAGICPGPALTLPWLHPQPALTFIAAMLAGMFFARKLAGRKV